MALPSTLDQATLMLLWKLANDAQEATNGQKFGWKHVYIRTVVTKGEKKLTLVRETGFLHWCLRIFNKKHYAIQPNSSTALLLKQLHDATRMRDESALSKAVSASSLPRNGLGIDDIVNKIKTCSRTVNVILQHIMQRKVENALEDRQEAIKIFFSDLFLPNWGLADARRAEMIRAQEELSRAQEVATSTVTGIVEKVQAYLDAATAQLNLAMTQKEEAEQLLQQATSAKTSDGLELTVQKAKECAGAADDAVMLVSEIIKQADMLVKANENQESRPIINFSEIEELKKFREIVNVVGQAAEYAQSAKNAATKVVELASKKATL